MGTSGKVFTVSGWRQTRKGSMLTHRQGPLGGSSMAVMRNKAFNLSGSDEQCPLPPFLLRSHVPEHHHGMVAEVGAVGSIPWC